MTKEKVISELETNIKELKKQYVDTDKYSECDVSRVIIEVDILLNMLRMENLK